MIDESILTEKSESSSEKFGLAARDSQLDARSSQFDPRSSSLPCPRVLFVDQTAKLGGAELCLKDLVVRRDGNDRIVLFEHGPLEAMLESSGIDVSVCVLGYRASSIRKASGLATHLASAGDLARAVRRIAAEARQFDVVYANTPKALVVTALAAKLAGRPVIYHLHDILSDEHFSNSNVRLLVTLANRLCRNVIANSHATADAFVRAGGIREKVTVIYNGFDTTQFEDTQTSSSCTYGSTATSAIPLPLATRNSQVDSLAFATSVIAVFGRLAPWKGQHVAIEAMGGLPGVHLLLVGDALFGEDEYVASLHSMAETPAVRGRVHFLGFRDDVVPLMRLADVVVHCSTAPEPFGRVIVEAMLSRRPVIASDAGGAAEIIDNGRTGILTPPGDVEALRDALISLLTDSEAAQRLADAGWSDARRRFGIEDRVAETNAVIEQACESRG